MSKRVLIVEDEVLVAMLVEELLERLGFEVAAVSSRLEEALELARTIEIDFAMLDINLNGRQSFPVAEALRARGVPFIFATGYGERALAGDFDQVPVVQKPFSRKDLNAALEKLCLA